jgi:hypothetical protein
VVFPGKSAAGNPKTETVSTATFWDSGLQKTIENRWL